MNIVFLGTPYFAKEILENLTQYHDILALITQPDKPFGRKKILKPPHTKEYALIKNIPCFQPEKSNEIISILHKIESKDKIDIILVVAYGKILSKEIVNNYMCINLHGSILPYYRGASPIQTSIINDYKHFGLSIIKMNEGLDSGDILATQEIQKDLVENKNLEEVFKFLVPYSINLINNVLDNILSNTLQPTPQNHMQATYCLKINKQDCYIDFLDSYNCYLRFLALGSIGVWTRYKGMILKISNIISYNLDYDYNQVGIILDIQKDSACISCKKGFLCIESVIPQNKSKMSIISFLQSQKLKIGDILHIDSN